MELSAVQPAVVNKIDSSNNVLTSVAAGALGGIGGSVAVHHLAPAVKNYFYPPQPTWGDTAYNALSYVRETRPFSWGIDATSWAWNTSWSAASWTLSAATGNPGTTIGGVALLAIGIAAAKYLERRCSKP